MSEASKNGVAGKPGEDGVRPAPGLEALAALGTSGPGPFAHLHCHTHYSLLDGANRIPELVAHVKAQGMNACAMTDHGTLAGAIEFYGECQKGGINPIIGYEAYVAPGRRTEKTAKGRGEAGFHLTLLAMDVRGFKNLIRMATAASLEGYYYVPRIDKELLAAHSEGIACLSGCASGEFSELILKNRMGEAERLAAWFSGLFPGRFYVEIQNNGLDIQRVCAEGAIDIASRLGLPLVATSDAHYLTREDAAAHDVLLCINTGAKLSDSSRMRYGNGGGTMVDQFHVCGPEEMYRRFPKHHEAVRQSQAIADACDIRLDFKKRHFPVFVPPAEKTPEAYLRELCEAGLKARYGPEPPAEAVARLEHELGIVCRMGFAGYFLIVWDCVRFATERGIPSGARGSAVGAIISYCLRLSHVCPLENKLLFERFLDPSRAEAPDIDLDLCQDRREEVIAYVRQKYGEASVAQIATFGTLGAKAAIRDVARVADLPLADADRLAKMVPEKVGTTLDDALAKVPELEAEYNGTQPVRFVIDMARRLEGTNRQAGVHAAGVVISHGPLVEHVPLQRAAKKGDDTGRKSAEAVVTTQWVMGDLEKVGLLKMDFLGLRTLTLMDNCVRIIRQTRGELVDLERLPKGDPETYELLRKGDTRGVFQLESDGIRELMKRMRPDRFGDLVATVALYRPGPLGGGMVDAYINRKHGREEVPAFQPDYDRILADTYGVVTYQEQCMMILHLLGGIELAKSYACIKAISKKKEKDVEAFRAQFVNGAAERIGEDAGERVFSLISEFAGYGFNRSICQDTLVPTPAGPVRLADFRPGQKVYAVGRDGRVALTDVVALHDHGTLEGYEVTFDDGLRVTCSIDHKFLTRDGQRPLWQVVRDGLDVLAASEEDSRGCEGEGWRLDGPVRRAVQHDGAQGPAHARLRPLPGDGMGRQDARGPLRGVLPHLPGAGEAPARLRGVRPRQDGEHRRPHGPAEHGQPLAGAAGRVLRDGQEDFGQAGHPGVACGRPAAVAGGQPGPVRGGGGRPGAVQPEYVQQDGAMAPAGAGLACGPRPVPGHGQARGLRQRGRVGRGGRLLPLLPGTEPASAQAPGGRAGARPGPQRGGVPSRQRDALAAVNGVLRLVHGGDEAGVAGDDAGHAPVADTGRLVPRRVVRVVPVGLRRMYDLEVACDTHNFLLPGGVATSNSHASAYADVTYKTGFLKAHYPAEFAAALLSSDTGDRDTLVAHIDDSRRLGVPVVPPDVNTSDVKFTVDGAGRVVFGLLAVKGVGEAAAREIVAARDEGGPFRDIHGLAGRLNPQACGKAALEKLLKAGALDALLPPGGHRAQLLAALPSAAAAASGAAKDRARGQLGLFGGPEEGGAEPVPLPHAEPWSKGEMLRHEKEALDLYLSSHPLALHEAEVRQFATHAVADVASTPAGTRLAAAGVVSQVRLMNTKTSRNGGPTRYARFKLEDTTGTVECVMWPDSFAADGMAALLADDAAVYAIAAVEAGREQPGLVVTRLIPLADGPRRLARGLALRLHLSAHGPAVIDKLAVLLARRRGPDTARRVPVHLFIVDGAGNKAELKAGDEWAVSPAAVDVAELEEVAGAGNVRFMGHRSAAGKPPAPAAPAQEPTGG